MSVSVNLVFPEPHVLNEAWGGMSLSRYKQAVAETPQWKIWVSFFFFLPHPYEKYTRSSYVH